MATTKQFLIRLTFNKYGVKIRSYEIKDDENLRATKSNEDYHINDNHSFLPLDDIEELIEEHLAEARYLGYEATSEKVNVELYELD